MKTLITTLPLCLTLIACGGDSTSTDAISTTSTTSNNNTAAHAAAALNDSTQELSDKRKDALAHAYLQLDTQALQDAKIQEPFADEQQFAKFAVSDALPSVRLARPVTILVPTGTAERSEDANRVAEFYVVYDIMAQSAETTFGPFPLFGAEGSSCGGFVGLACDEGLSCVTQSNVADVMGTCEPNE